MESRKTALVQDYSEKWGNEMVKDIRVALVTGGNRGIGYELVKQLSLKGYKVILACRDPEKGHKAVQKLNSMISKRAQSAIVKVRPQ